MGFSVLYATPACRRLGTLVARRESLCRHGRARFRFADDGVWALVSGDSEALHRASDEADECLHRNDFVEDRFAGRYIRLHTSRAAVVAAERVAGLDAGAGDFLLAAAAVRHRGAHRPG